MHQSADVRRIRSKFEKVFFFCTQTISTVGFGALSPAPDSDVVNFFVFLLIIMGLIVSTLLTGEKMAGLVSLQSIIVGPHPFTLYYDALGCFVGFTWAKFSIPKASTILFSDNLLLTSCHSERAIMFRAANNRDYGVIEGSFRCAFTPFRVE